MSSLTNTILSCNARTPDSYMEKMEMVVKCSAITAAALPMVRSQLWEVKDVRARSADRLACQQSAPNLSDSRDEQFIADKTVSA